MKLSLTSRRWIILSVLVVAGLLAARLVIGREGAVASTVSSPASDRPHATSKGSVRTESARQTADLNLALLSRPVAQEIEEHLFTVPPPPAAPAGPAPRPTQSFEAAPPKPVAPPLPFKFLGRMVDGGVTTAFVAYGSQNLNVKEGDEIEKLYRVEKIADSQLVFVYLPLHERQTLATGARP